MIQCLALGQSVGSLGQQVVDPEGGLGVGVKELRMGGDERGDVRLRGAGM